jgi:5-methylcytosine-specific restriction endonuclease McrA
MVWADGANASRSTPTSGTFDGDMTRSLVLNASFEPLGVISSRRALLLVLNSKAEQLENSGAFFNAATASFPEPSVVRLIQFVRVPYGARVAMSRRAVFARDNHKCQYCGAPAENIDHVIPRSRGGQHAWDNVVAACRACNSRKEDRLLSEISMRLSRMPLAPRSRAWVIAATGTVPQSWRAYLGVGGDADLQWSLSA